MCVENPSMKKSNDSRSSFLKWFFKGISLGIVVSLALIFLASFAIPRVINAVPLTVLSGSMVPTFNPGDLIVTTHVNDASEEIERGDIVTFQPESGNSKLITHRVISKGFTISGEGVFVTKGDANNISDKAIIEDQIMGKYLYRIPYIGYIANIIPINIKPVILQILGVTFLGYALTQFFSSFRVNRSKKSNL